MSRQRREVPWLEQHGNGQYYVFWYDPPTGHTKRLSLKTNDAGIAARKYGEFLIAGPVRTVDARLTVGQALDDYLREHVNAVDDKGRPRVVDTRRQEVIARHLKAHFGEAEIAPIGPVESRAYAAVRRKAGTSDSTIRRELVCLVAAFNHAVKWGRIAQDSRCRVELTAEEHRDRVEWLTKAQVECALALADGPFRDFLTILYYTGARRAAIENLLKTQVDLKNGRIDLMTTVIPIGVRRSPMTTKRTKKRRPIVPIYPEMRAAVERRMAEEGPWLFPHCNRYAQWFVDMMRDDFGIKAHLHMLRHSRASHLLQDGESIFKVAKLLGDTVATVEKVYGHSSPEFLQTGS